MYYDIYMVRSREASPDSSSVIGVHSINNEPEFAEMWEKTIGDKKRFLTDRFWDFTGVGRYDLAQAIGTIIKGVVVECSEFQEVEISVVDADELRDDAPETVCLALIAPADRKFFAADWVSTSIVEIVNDQLYAAESSFIMANEIPVIES